MSEVDKKRKTRQGTVSLMFPEKSLFCAAAAKMQDTTRHSTDEKVIISTYYFLSKYGMIYSHAKV